MSQSFIYLLVFPLHDMFKIGKADDLDKRITTLKAEWGRLDADRSFYLRVKQHRVFATENTLHNTLAPFKKTLTQGDGHSEMFHLKGLDTALNAFTQYDANPRGLTPRAMQYLDNTASFEQFAQALFSELSIQGEAVCTQLCHWIDHIANEYNHPARPACYDVIGANKIAITVPRKFIPQQDNLPFHGIIPTTLRGDEDSERCYSPCLDLIAFIQPMPDFTTFVLNLGCRKEHDTIKPHLQAIKGIIKAKLPRNNAYYNIK